MLEEGDFVTLAGTVSQKQPMTDCVNVPSSTATGSPEPIAIIGLSCRLPGGASSPRELWTSLESGVSAWSKGPSGRFNMSAFYDPKNNHTGTTNTNGGHFLSQDISAFDAAFFGINPLEAKAMDPQQRILLEVAYEAFENAGLTPEQLWASNSGVYVGQWASDYSEMLSRDIEYPATYHATGTGPAITSNRISYQFNLHGPSFTVDTGCSASIVALHMAVQSLRSHETEMSFVGGVNILGDPQRFIYQSKMKMFSDDGRSYSFDHRANGYGRGEGCSGVVLKPLSAALRDGDRIRGVIRNSVLNQDGRTSGITLPSGDAQEKAIRKAYGDVGLELRADYVEAHGTGTVAGDPIEVEAIANALSKNLMSGNKLVIGSLKGNIGHTESAAGLSGLIKAVLMLEAGAIPPQVNFEKANDKILFEEWNLRIPLKLEHHDLHRISINSFGYGGTNAHVILDAAKDHLTHVDKPLPPASNSASRVFIISAASEKSCQALATKLDKYLSQMTYSSMDGQWFNQLAYTLNRRAIYKYYATIVAAGPESLRSSLQACATKPVFRTGTTGQGRVVYIFSGQGAQYYNMGRELLHIWPQFTSSLRRANSLLVRFGCTWDVFHELQRDEEDCRLDDPALGQPLSTAIQLALVDTLAALGLMPIAVAGHSSGEIAAAYCSGFLAFEDALKVSYHRGRLASELLRREPDLHGAMLAVGSSAGTVAEYIAQLDDSIGNISIACYNSPTSVTLSGDAVAIDKLSRVMEADSIFTRKLRTHGAAYHSDQMRRIEDEYYRALEGIEARSGSQVVMVSSLTGTEVQAQLMDRAYWVKNLVSPVLFEDALWTLCSLEEESLSVDVILEIGPHSQLAGPVKQTLQSVSGKIKDIKYLTTLQRRADASVKLLCTLADLHAHGVAIDLHSANNSFQNELPALLLDVPSYAFDHHQTFWHEGRLSKEFKNRQFTPHELLGNLSSDVNVLEPRWRRFLSLKELPWLRSHIVQGQIIFPAAGYLAMAIEAMRRHKLMLDPAAKIEAYKLRNVSIGKALVIEEDVNDHEICFSLRPEARTARHSSSIWMEFRVFTVAADASWTEHCRGNISAITTTPSDTIDSLDARTHELSIHPDETKSMVQQSRRCVNPLKFYYMCRDLGLEWKSPFKNIANIATSMDASICTTVSAEESQYETDDDNHTYLIHPGMLDNVLFHGLCAILVLEQGLTSPPVPTFIKTLSVSASYNERPGMPFTSYSKQIDGPSTFDVVVGTGSDGEEKFVLRASGVTVTKLPGNVTSRREARELCHSAQWVTYNEILTTKRIHDICNASVVPGSIAEQTDYLDSTVMMYVQHALREVSVNQVVEGYRRQYYEWMQIYAETADEKLALPASGSPVSLGVVGEALGMIGPNLPDILRGEVEPLAVLTQGGMLSRLYSEERCPRCYAQMAAYCRELAMQKPGMKVIEVGAGTGSATQPVLESLFVEGKGLISSYDFTDISPAFFESAKERLSKFSNILHYKTLDIERDVPSQGFQAETYDVAIACNIIHATKSIGVSLDHVRSLLRPGGVFILMEITNGEPYYNLIFGSLPGWWAGVSEGRTLSPLLKTPQWRNLLNLSHLSPHEYAIKDYEESAGGTLTVFISTATAPAANPLSSSIDIILDRGTATLGLADDLRSKLPLRTVTSSDIHAAGHRNVISIFSPEICEALAGPASREIWESFKARLLSSEAGLLITKGSVWESDHPASAIMTGFARCFRVEHPEIRLITLDLGSDTDPSCYSSIIAVLLQEQSFDLSRSTPEIENEFAERGGQLFVARMIHESSIDRYVYESLDCANAKLAPFIDNMDKRTLVAQLSVPGLLESLRWVEEESTPSLDPDEIEVELCAASINFKDVLIAAGQLEGETEMKNDCSGVVTDVGENMRQRFRKGDRVCCYYSRSYTNRPRVHGDCCVLFDDKFTFTEAASIPVVWATVYYSLIDHGRLAKGDTVLIHSAAGAIGQAAIIMAQYLRAEVYVTVSSKEKKNLLNNKFNIPDDHIFSSRTTAFGEKIRKATSGKGVDVVLNSLSGDIFRESCNLVAPFGRFVEIGRKEFLDDLLMPSRFLLKNITFAYVDLAGLIIENKPLARRLLCDVMSLLSSGALRLTSITVMPISEIESAFRMIQAGKHVGKVILSVEDGQMVKVVPRPPSPAALKADGLYLVVGGFGGLGKVMVRWLASRGARQIMVASRSGVVKEGDVALIDDMHLKGVVVHSRSCDITSLSQVKALLAEIEHDQTMPLVRGLINLAMVLEDATFVEMTSEQWSTAVLPKVCGSWNLHTVLPADMDFFLLMSSTVTITGNLAQCNYAAGCAYQDALARYRGGQGLAGYSINVGPVSDTGFVSENPEVAIGLRRQGMGTLSTAQLLALVNYAISRPSIPDSASRQCAIGFLPNGNERDLGPSTWLSNSRFRHVRSRDELARETTIESATTSDNSIAILAAISKARTAEETLEQVCLALLHQLAKLTATPVEGLSDLLGLNDFGVDSLVAVELRNWIGAYLQVNIPMLVLRNTKSIRELAKLVTKDSRLAVTACN